MKKHYYAFGLTMNGISGKALNFGSPENKKKKFQGQEFDDDLGVDIYEFKYRMDDPQIGRFWQIDPLADKYEYNSTYAFSENHVTNHVELEGLEMVSAASKVYLAHQEGAKAAAVAKEAAKEAKWEQEELNRRVAANLKMVDGLVTFGLTMNYCPGAPEMDFEAVEGVTVEEAVVPEATVIGKEAKALPQGAEMVVTDVKTGAQDVKVGPYSNLSDPKTVGVGKDFTKAQKQAILDENKLNNGGVMKSDMSGKTADAAVQSKKGVPANMNQAEIDHIIPKAKGGTNSYSNAQVLTKVENLIKGAN